MKHIYLLIDPINKIVRYVGATSNPKSRLNQHVKDASKPKKKGRTKKQEWILSLQKKGMIPEMKIICSEESKEKAREIEEQTVLKYIDTIFNIHMPGKGSLSINHFKKTGKTK